MSEILIKLLPFRINFTNTSIYDVHICVKVCTHPVSLGFLHKMHNAFTYVLYYTGSIEF